MGPMRSLRRRLARLIDAFSPARVRRQRRFARLFPRFLPLSDRQSKPIVSGLVGAFRKLSLEDAPAAATR